MNILLYFHYVVLQELEVDKETGILKIVGGSTEASRENVNENPSERSQPNNIHLGVPNDRITSASSSSSQYPVGS